MKGYLLRNLSVLNVLVFIAILLSVRYGIFPLLTADTTYVPPAARPGTTAEEGGPARKEAPPALDYAVIAEKNLFNPERKSPVEKPAGSGSAASAPLPKPEFVLYGTLLADEGSIAYMEDKMSPISTPGRGKRASVLRKGDSISGFVVKDIGPDRVVLARGDEKMTVSLNEPKPRGNEGAGNMHGGRYAPGFSGGVRNPPVPAGPPAPARR